MSKTVAVLGGGAWGTALACVARRAGRPVRMWVRNPQLAEAISHGSNPSRLPGVPLERGIEASTDLAEVLYDADFALMAVPSQVLRSVAEAAAPFLADGLPVAICAKGIERGSLKRMSEVLAEALPAARPCVFSGPTFAAEVARGLPTAITLAAEDQEAAKQVQAGIGSGSLRAYLSDDPIGAELGGAIKNVIALAAGIATGRGLGENARAALVSRGLAEMVRLSVAEGGRAETLMGLAGAGDLILTAMSTTSRNTSFGIAVGEGRRISDVLTGRRAVTEGYWSTQAVAALAARSDVDMPITQTVNAILDRQIDVDDAVTRLMGRPLSTEFRH